MIIRDYLQRRKNPVDQTTLTLPQYVELTNGSTISGQSVTAETARNVHTAYRCINIISDDIAKMPLQVYQNAANGKIERVKPDSRLQNISWLLEKQPNRWMTPFIFKKTTAQWVMTHGTSYWWHPTRKAGHRHEIFILPSDRTTIVPDENGALWYRYFSSNGEPVFIPDVEVVRVIINSKDGIYGNSVISYAREAIGRRLAADETQAKVYAQGLMAGGIMWMTGEVNKEARKKLREAYTEGITGSENAGNVVIFDNKVTKFEQLSMKATDMQFLESLDANDTEIANFFGLPLYKLNKGKESYNANEQQNLDYLSTTLDPFLVQIEQAASLKLLSDAEQENTYLRFNRDALLRTDSKTRAETLEKRILSGQLTPNEARQIEDMSAYPAGNQFYMPMNFQSVTAPKEEE